MHVVEYDHVSRTYPRGIQALRDVTVGIPEGKVYGVVGRNGAGKTTMLRMIPALLHPTEGAVRVFNDDPWEHEEIKKRIGYLSEEQTMPKYLRVAHMVDLCAELYPTWDSAMASGFMQTFGLDRTRRIGNLSKGQQRQVGLICAVCHKPDLLVLDEPAGGLDPVARREFLEAVLNLLAESGSTIILSSHIMSDIERVATDILILHEGQILLNRPLDELKENFCRVELQSERMDISRLRAAPGLLAAKDRDGRLTAVLPCAAGQASGWITTHLPGLGLPALLSAQPMNLEDLFIELTGDTA